MNKSIPKSLAWLTIIAGLLLLAFGLWEMQNPNRESAVMLNIVLPIAVMITGFSLLSQSNKPKQ